jgi:hypothetical protein
MTNPYCDRSPHVALRRRRETACVLSAIFTLLFLLPAVQARDAEWRIIEEYWYVIEIGDARAGWSSTIVHDDGKRYRTTTEMQLNVGRADAPVEIGMSSTFIESHDGKPVRAASQQRMSQQPLESEWIFENGAVRHITRQNGRETEREAAAPEGVWLTPRAASRYVFERAKAGADEITYRAIDPQAGVRAISVRSVRSGEDTFDTGDRTIPVTIWRTKTDLVPIESIEHWSSDGTMVYQEMNIGVGRMVMRLSTREEAMAKVAGGVPELLVRTFITPDKPIANVMRATTATLRLKTKDGSLPELPSAGSQRVEMSEDGRSALVRIDIAEHLPAAPDDEKNDEYRKPSGAIDSDDEVVQRLAQRAVRSAGDEPMQRAEAMRAFVYRYIDDKGLDTAFATASETARTRTGDCSEHGVLLAALLRANGIPSRLASGLIYVEGFLDDDEEDGIFGWHMWTQALISGRWVDLDATLPVRRHAGAVLVSTTALADGLGDADLATIVLLMGNLDIDVLDVTHK